MQSGEAEELKPQRKETTIQEDLEFRASEELKSPAHLNRALFN